VKITAAVAWAAGEPLSIEELDLDDPRPDEILVRVEAVGVCHTDENARLGRLPVVYPIILGHEGAGIVERTGEAVTRVRPGDRVLFTPDYCGRCQQCVLGFTPYCDQVVPVTADAPLHYLAGLTRGGADVALDTTGNPAVILAAVESLATHGTASVITSSGAPVTVPPGALLLKGRSLRGSMGGHINPTVFIPRLLDLHRQGRFPVERLVRNYPFAELATAIADSHSGATIKPVLTFAA
jgi:Zn-dependent alcohol dehydrogenase